MYYPSMEEKVPLLIALLRQADARRTMIFVNTKRMAERLESVLNANGFNSQAISGDVPQPKRLRFLRDFHNGDLAVLIATDVASRGLHIRMSATSSISTCPRMPGLCHRIGGRPAGAEGDAISFACEEFAYRCRRSRPTSATKCLCTDPQELIAGVQLQRARRAKAARSLTAVAVPEEDAARPPPQQWPGRPEPASRGPLNQPEPVAARSVIRSTAATGRGRARCPPSPGAAGRSPAYPRARAARAPPAIVHEQRALGVEGLGQAHAVPERPSPSATGTCAN